jgi:hypothetical protein
MIDKPQKSPIGEHFQAKMPEYALQYGLLVFMPTTAVW